MAELMKRDIIMYDREVDIGVDKSKTFEFMKDIIKFHGVLLQKLPSGRHIEKDISNHQVCARSGRGRLL